MIFLARWHHFARKLPFGEAPQPGRIDVRLSQAPGLASIPRVIYALLRCPLLATSTPVATDHAAALQTLWSSLGPDALLRAIHPMLVAFDDPESDKHSREPLSRDSLASGKGRVLLMDAFDVIVVLYRAAATSNLGAEALPFPPPAGSALRALVRRLVSARGIAPEVRSPFSIPNRMPCPATYRHARHCVMCTSTRVTCVADAHVQRNARIGSDSCPAGAVLPGRRRSGAAARRVPDR